MHIRPFHIRRLVALGAAIAALWPAVPTTAADGVVGTRTDVAARPTARELRLAVRMREEASMRIVSIPFDVDRHGFAFGNWAGYDASSAVSISDVRTVLGDDLVCASSMPSADCTHDEGAQSIAAKVSALLATGRCEGMVLAAYERFIANDPTARTLTRAEVTPDIKRWSLSQLAPAARSATVRSRLWNLREVVDAITDDLRRGGGATLGLHREGGSHAVLPLGVVDSGTTAVIRVYDANAPGLTQSLEVNFARNHWSYVTRNASGLAVDTWRGGAIGDLDVVRLDERRMN